MLHNSCFLSHDNLSKVYYAVKRIADFVIPQEYGIEREDKLAIGVEIARPLLVRHSIDYAPLYIDFARAPFEIVFNHHVMHVRRIEFRFEPANTSNLD